MNSLAIELSSWILYDGNYDTTNFETGQNVRFAVEFYLPEYSICADSLSLNAAEGRPSFYKTVAEVTFYDKSVWILNLGDISVFRDDPPHYVKTGQHVKGELSLHIDPFTYYEELYKVPGIQPLIYEWHIDAIEMDVSPIVETADNRGRRIKMRDETKICYEPVDRIDLRKERAGGDGSYVLYCSKLDRPPSKTIWT